MDVGKVSRQEGQTQGPTSPAFSTRGLQTLLRACSQLCVAEPWEGNSSAWTPRHKCKVHRSRLFPTEEHVFLWKDHTEESGFLLFPESGLCWPFGLSCIREPRPHPPGRNLEIVSSGASEPLVKADSWASLPQTLI